MQTIVGRLFLKLHNFFTSGRPFKNRRNKETETFVRNFERGKVVVVFYGASVTQQSVNRSGEITGYVPNVIANLRSKFGDDAFEFHQLGYGSNHFNDAGFVFFPELLEKKPDIVAMDWHSTWLSKFPGDLYAYVIDTLISAGVRVINCVFPRKSCIGQPERDNVKQARWFQSKGVPLINLYDEIGSSINPEICLRDETHTTTLGAAMYGHIVTEKIVDVLNGQKIEPSVGETIAPPKKYSVPIVDRYSANFDLAGGDLLDILLGRSADYPRVKLLGCCLVGPFAPILDIETCSGKWHVAIWDQWCYYERVCLKGITPEIGVTTAEEFRVRVGISDTDLNYSLAGKKRILLWA